MARKTKSKAGKLSMSDMRSLINKKAGMSVAHDLTNSNPTEVKDWIPTGSRWLDSNQRVSHTWLPKLRPMLKIWVLM